MPGPARTCGEHWPEARSRDSALCQNCANTNSSVPLARCFICLRKDVPGQFHHSASERQHATLGRHLCLNCHAILTHRQETKWRPEWKTEQHPRRYIVQGDIDVVMLWIRRNPGSSSLRELGAFLLRSLGTLGGLRPCRLGVRLTIGGRRRHGARRTARRDAHRRAWPRRARRTGARTAAGQSPRAHVRARCVAVSVGHAGPA